MSVWMLGFSLFVLLNSEVNAKDDRKHTIGEQLDVIIKDVSEYLLWLFGYNDSVEDQIEVSEVLVESFLEDVNDMIELMHEEADKHMKHVKEISELENDKDKDKKKSNETVSIEDKSKRKEETSEDTSETEEKEKVDHIAVIPIVYQPESIQN